MKGFGGRLLTFVFGMITGIIVFVLGLGGALYGIVTSVKVSQIEEKTGTDYTAGTPVADMSLLQLFNKLKETVADKDNITLASIEEVYGIDLVAKIESALEIQAENKTVLVKADELAAYDVEQSLGRLNRYVFNDETKAIELQTYTDAEGNVKAQQLPIVKAAFVDGKNTAGGNYSVYFNGTQNVIQFKLTDTFEDKTARYTVSAAGELTESASGAYIKLHDGMKDLLKDTKLMSVSSNLNLVINMLTLDSISANFNLALPDMSLIQDYENLPVMQGIQAIIEEINGASDKTFGEIEELLGLSLGEGGVADFISSYKISEINKAVEEMTVGDLKDDIDRDIYVRVSDFSAYNEGEGLPAYVNKFDLTGARPALTAKGSVKNGENYVIATDGENLTISEIVDGTPQERTEKFVVITNTDGKNEIVAYDETAHAGLEVYVRVHEGSGILSVLAGTNLNSFDSTVGTIKLGDVMDIYESDTYVQSDSGEYALVDGAFVPYEESMGDTYIRYTLKEKSQKILIELRNTTLDNLSSKMKELTISSMLDGFDRDIYALYTDITAAAEGDLIDGYISRVENGSLAAADDQIRVTAEMKSGERYTLKDFGGTLKIVYDAEGEYVKVHEGTSTAALKALADASLDNMNSVIENLILGEVMEIERADVFEVCADDACAHSKHYKYLDGIGYVKAEAGYAGTKYYKAVEKSSELMLRLADTKVTEIAAEAQAIMDELKLSDVIEIDADRYRDITAEEYAALASADVESLKSYAVITSTDADVPGLIPGMAYSILRREGKYVINGAEYDALPAQEFIKYRIYEGLDNVLMKKLSGITVNYVAAAMKDVVKDVRLCEVITIDVDEFDAVTDTAAIAEAFAAGNLFKKADNGYWYVIVTVAPLPGDTEGYYVRTYEGSDNAIIKKLANVCIGEVSRYMQDAVNDTTFGELNIGGSDEKGIFQQPAIKNAKISEIDDAIKSTLEQATLVQINDWANLGIEEDNLLLTVLGNMTIKDFFTTVKNNISLDGSGNVVISFPSPVAP